MVNYEKQPYMRVSVIHGEQFKIHIVFHYKWSQPLERFICPSESSDKTNKKKATTTTANYNKTAHQSKWQHEANVKRQWWNGQQAFLYACHAELKIPNNISSKNIARTKWKIRREKWKMKKNKRPAYTHQTKPTKKKIYTTESKLRRYTDQTPKWKANHSSNDNSTSTSSTSAAHGTKIRATRTYQTCIKWE